MCGGASSTQKELQQEQAEFYKTQVKAYNTAYPNFKDIQDRLNAQFDPIIAKGPNQMGFNSDELTDLNTQATEGTAANYAAAKRALQNDIAVEGGGTSNVNLTGGPSNQLREELASTGAGVESAGQLAIKQAGYAQGYSEYRDAVAGEEDLAAGWNPNSFAGSTTSAGKVASDTANEVQKADAGTWNAVFGALGGIAGNVSYSKAGGWGLGG